jgi:hypothetical protein
MCIQAGFEVVSVSDVEAVVGTAQHVGPEAHDLRRSCRSSFDTSGRTVVGFHAYVLRFHACVSKYSPAEQGVTSINYLVRSCAFSLSGIRASLKFRVFLDLASARIPFVLRYRRMNGNLAGRLIAVTRRRCSNRNAKDAAHNCALNSRISRFSTRSLSE